MKSADDIVKQLEQPLDDSLVAYRKAGWSNEVPYLEGVTVDRKLNAIFGPLHWDEYTTVDPAIYLGEKERRDKNGKVVMRDGKPVMQHMYSASAHCSLTVEYLTPENEKAICQKSGHGTGSGIDESKAEAIESAEKEAETDARKRAAKKFGKAFGEDLYDKAYIKQLKARRQANASKRHTGKGPAAGTQKRQGASDTHSAKRPDRGAAQSADRAANADARTLGDVERANEQLHRKFFAAVNGFKEGLKRFLQEKGYQGANGKRVKIAHWNELPWPVAEKLMRQPDSLREKLEAEGYVGADEFGGFGD